MNGLAFSSTCCPTRIRYRSRRPLKRRPSVVILYGTAFITPQTQKRAKVGNYSSPSRSLFLAPLRWCYYNRWTSFITRIPHKRKSTITRRSVFLFAHRAHTYSCRNISVRRPRTSCCSIFYRLYKEQTKVSILNKSVIPNGSVQSFYYMNRA